eukprot:12072589-Prorocentrum_lima.AAC.1
MPQEFRIIAVGSHVNFAPLIGRWHEAVEIDAGVKDVCSGGAIFPKFCDPVLLWALHEIR